MKITRTNGAVLSVLIVLQIIAAILVFFARIRHFLIALLFILVLLSHQMLTWKMKYEIKALGTEILKTSRQLWTLDNPNDSH